MMTRNRLAGPVTIVLAVAMAAHVSPSMRAERVVKSVQEAAAVARPFDAGLEKLQGVWTADPAQSSWFRIHIREDVVAVDLNPGQQTIYGYLRTDDSKNPLHIDLTLEHMGTVHGIYSLQNNTLKLCLNAVFGSGERPADFVGAKTQTLINLTRNPPIAAVGPDIEAPSFKAAPGELSVSPASSKGTIELPKPTGPHGIGRISLYGIDSSRDEMNLDTRRHYRELMVHVFYPVERGARAPVAPYYPAFALVTRTLGETAMKEDLEDAYPAVSSARAHTVLGAPVAEQQDRYPAIVFLPGQGANSTQYTALIEDLVSHGYIVAGIEHTYYASAVVLPGDRVVRFAAARWEQGLSGSFGARVLFDQAISDMLADDAVFVLDELIRLDAGTVDSPLKGRIETSRVGIAGHSIGGRGAALASQRDRRFSCCLSLDGFAPALDAFGNFGGWTCQQPFMMLRPEFREPPADVLRQAKMTPRNFRDWQERARLERKAFFERVQSGAWEVVFDFPGAGHGSFSDLPLLAPGLGAAPELRDRTMRAIRAYSRAFFDRILRKERNTLLDGRSGDFPEVTIQQFRPLSR